MSDQASGVPQQSFPFFVGAGRSGTTLLRAMFDAHGEIAIPRESRFVVRLARERHRYEQDSGFEVETFEADFAVRLRHRPWDLSLDEAREALMADVTSYPEAVRCLYSYYARREGKSRYGDKTPSYVTQLPLLKELFPEAKFVHIIRDGRDVALSHLDIEGWGPRSLDEAAVQWRRHVLRGITDGAALGSEAYKELRYEQLVEAPEGVLKGLCDFVGLSYDPAMLRYFERAEKVAGQVPHFQNLYRPPTKGLRDWRRQMDSDDVGRFESLAGDLLAELGYETSGRHRLLQRPAAFAKRLGARKAGLRVRATRLWRTAGRRGSRRLR
jgi:hypothetical protein